MTRMNGVWQPDARFCRPWREPVSNLGLVSSKSERRAARSMVADYHDDVRSLLREAAATVHVAPGSDVLESARRASPRRRLRGLVAAAAAVIVVAGGTAVGLGWLEPNRSPTPGTTPNSSAGDPTTRASTPSPSAATDAPRPKMVGVPILVGYTQREAVRRVKAWGLEPKVSVEPAPCIPEGEVTMSVPSAATRVGAGSRVIVVVSAGGSAGMPSVKVCPGGIASDQDRSIAENLLKFANNPRQRIAPFAPAVHLGLGEGLYQEVLERDLRDSDAWRICAQYAERSCPMSALTTLAQMGDVTVNALREPEDRCYAGDPPADLAGRRVIRIEQVLPAVASCASYASVDVYVSDVGQISAVVLRLGSP